jgi:hypothetical protein
MGRTVGAIGKHPYAHGAELPALPQELNEWPLFRQREFAGSCISSTARMRCSGFVAGTAIRYML